MAQEWTFETLARASKETYENILLTGTPPDIEQLNGFIYCGWNHEPIGKISGEKFKKGFYKRGGANYGYNETVIQDRKKYLGEWKVGLHEVRPNQLGYFRTSYVKDEPYHKLYQPYLHLAHFNYDIPFHKFHLSFFRVIRDFVVLPNPGDHSLMLCKAYLHITEDINIFYCYFLLGHRLEIKCLPW
jgi:hypothetical protein